MQGLHWTTINKIKQATPVIIASISRCSQITPCVLFLGVTSSPATFKKDSFPSQMGPQPCLSLTSTEAPARSSMSTASTWPFSAAQCSGSWPRGPRGKGQQIACSVREFPFVEFRLRTSRYTQDTNLLAKKTGKCKLTSQSKLSGLRF